MFTSCGGFTLDGHEQFMEEVCKCENSWDLSGEIFSKEKQGNLQVCKRTINGENKFGFVWDNDQCEEFIPFIYNDAGSFIDLHAPVKIDSLWGAIDSTGALKFDYLFESEKSARDSIRNYMLSEAIDSIWNLEKIQKLNSEIDSLSNGNRHLTIITTEEDGQFRIKLAEDNGNNLVTHLTFLVDFWNNWKIYYYDPLEDNRTEIGQWN